MRVAFIEQETQLGGVEYTTLRVAHALNKTKFEPLIICPDDGDLPSLASKAGLRVQIVHRPKFTSVSLFLGKRYFANPLGFVITTINVLRAANTLFKYLKSNPADIVISKGLLAHFYGGLAACQANIPCIWYIQEEVDKKRAAGLFRAILGYGAKRIPSRIIVDAQALLYQFDGLGIQRDDIEVIYNGVDTQEFVQFSLQENRDTKQLYNIPNDALVIGQVGRIIPLKGQSTLLEAFAKIAVVFPDVHLLFVGAPLFGSRDYEQSLRSKVEQYGLDGRVHFSGFIPDVRQGLAALDIFVHASIETDSPVSVIEAMSCGLPVIVSKVRGTVELVVPESDALVFPPGDSRTLAAILAKCIRDRDLRSKMGSQARMSVIQKFSLQASVAKLESLIEEVYAA
ncbi:MAG: glycosyltransferase family 4 protein [Chloroflexota bacterium]